MLDWLLATWALVRETAPWLFVGFLVAGLLKVWIPEAWILRRLGRDDFGAVATAAFAGAPLPLCSCSVLPTALALKDAGASRGATTSFLIATPETGVDSIGVTWALMDPVMTIARPLAALCTALGAGVAVNLFGGPPPAPDAPPDSAAHCCASEPGAPPAGAAPQRSGLRAAGAYAFGPLLRDLAPWLVLGFLLSGLIEVALPDDVFEGALLGGWRAMLVMLVAGVPLYVCATASTPIAAALMAKGLDPGAALVLLLAGPATNIATMTVVRGFLGGRVLAVYLVSIAAFALLAGWLVDLVYAGLGLDARAIVAAHSAGDGSLLSNAAGIALVALLAWDLARRARGPHVHAD